MRRHVLLWFAGLFALLASGAATAQEQYGPPPSLDRILPEVRLHHPGKFYDAEGPWPGPNGELRYRLKWMTPDGRIVWFDADARTGRVLGPDYDRHDVWSGRRQLRDEDRRMFNERWRNHGRFPRRASP